MSVERPIACALARSKLPASEIAASEPRRDPLAVQHRWDFKAFATFLQAQDAAWVMNTSATSRSPALAALPHPKLRSGFSTQERHDSCAGT